MSGLLQHLVQRVLAPETSLRPHAPNPFEPPRLLPLEGPTAPVRETLPRTAAEVSEPWSAPTLTPEVEPAGPRPKRRAGARRAGRRQPTAAVETPAALELEAELDASPPPVLEPRQASQVRAPVRRPEEQTVSAPTRAPQARTISDRLEAVQVAVQALEPANRVVDALRSPIAPQPAQLPGSTRALPAQRASAARELEIDTAPEANGGERLPARRTTLTESGEARHAPAQPPAPLPASNPFAFTRADRELAATSQSSAAPTVQISIGRVEIRAHTAPARTTPRSAAAKPALSLTAYLDQRGGKP